MSPFRSMTPRRETSDRHASVSAVEPAARRRQSMPSSCRPHAGSHHRHQHRKRERRRVANFWFAGICISAIAFGALWVSSATSRHVTLDDGTVWVTSLKDRKAARFNVRIGETTAAVAASAARFDVVQHGDDMMLSDGATATRLLASSLSEDGSAVIDADTTLLLGGGTAALVDDASGSVWLVAADDLGSVDPTHPHLELGEGGKAAVTSDGMFYGYRPADGSVLRVAKPGASSERIAMVNDGDPLAADDFTVVCGVPIVSRNGIVHWPSGRVDTGADRLLLQSPGADEESVCTVAVADRYGLHLVDPNAADPLAASWSDAQPAEPARPVSAAGCIHAAWSRAEDNYLRVCGHDGIESVGQEPFSTLETVSATSDLVFRVNHRYVLLNDVSDGMVWHPDRSTQTVGVQWSAVQADDVEASEGNDSSVNGQREFAATCAPDSAPMRAVDDEIGVRAGGMQILDVLRNDEQTDCSVLRIVSAEVPADAQMAVRPIHGGRYLQLDASRAKPGTVAFPYTVDDGRGHASTATVRLELTGADGNRSPIQFDAPCEYDVEQGAVYTANALSGFRDPDGDPLSLAAAAPHASGNRVSVSARADGQLTFDPGTMESGRIGVEVMVSDGQDIGYGMVYFSVHPAGTLPATVDAVSVQTEPGRSITVDLGPSVHATSAQPVTLASAEAPSGAQVTLGPDLSLSFEAMQEGVYHVPYVVMQTDVPTTGLVRVDVAHVSGDEAMPVAANDVALLGSDATAIVEPLSNDVDPMGGVLSVTSVRADAASGIAAGLVDHHRVYLTARRMPTKPVTVSYTVANAAGSSTGTIVLHPPASAASGVAPTAPDLDVQVRTGGIASVDVLGRVLHADGVDIELLDDLRYDPDTFRGLAFVSNGSVRYQADSRPGVYSLTYTVRDDEGNAASGTITVTVHEADADRKPAPTPQHVDAHVAAGHATRITIPLSGIDADGDDVVLLGLGNATPSLGRITEVGADYLAYEAYPDSVGTDTFSYAVEDWTGQRAQATVRVGIFLGNAQAGVMARDDEIRLRPGTSASVPVTANDIATHGSQLAIDGNPDVRNVDDVHVNGAMIELTAPQDSGTGYVTYTVRDPAGLRDTATLAVIVDEKAVIEPPVAYDYRVPSAATIDRKTVEVDVSPWIANPSGSIGELKVDVARPETDHARMLDDDPFTVSIDLTDEAHAVAYTVTNTTHNVTATAFIHVPAYGVFPPTLRPKAPRLSVHAGDTLIIDIADHVRVGAGKTARVSSPESASATKSDGGNPVVDDTTLRFAAATDYAGPASITFVAADAEPGDDTRIVNSAVLTLPITVIGNQESAPTFVPATIELEAGERQTVDLRALTAAPPGHAADRSGPSYAYSGGISRSAVSATVTDAGVMSIEAAVDATPGTAVEIPVSIGHASGTVDAAMMVRVIASTRPLARLRDIAADARSGSLIQVDALADAYNPFPDVPLEIVSCETEHGSLLTVADCGRDGSVSVRMPEAAGASFVVHVTVEDATHDPNRRVNGTVTVSVADVPSAPMPSPVSGDPEDGAVSLSWTPGAANGSPIAEYQVSWDGGRQSCGLATVCRITGLTNGRDYAFSIRARNAVGWSAPSSVVRATPDGIPSEPTAITVTGGYHRVDVHWRAPDKGGVPDRYSVSLANVQGGYESTQTVTGLEASFVVPDEAIANGSSFRATVVGRNRAGEGRPGVSAGTAQPWGDPGPIAVSLESVDRKGGMRVTVLAGELRNAGCSGITVDGDVQATLDCGSPMVSFTADRSMFGRPMRVRATLNPAKTGAVAVSAASGDVVVGYDVEAPSSLSFACEESRCTASWAATGAYDSFSVSASGFAERIVRDASATFELLPWQTFAGFQVRQILNGVSGPAATSGGQPYVRRVKATIELPDNVSWSPDAAHVIDVNGGSVEAWGRNVSAYIDIMPPGGPSCAMSWNGGSQKLDVSQCHMSAAGDTTWSVRVVSNVGETDIDHAVRGGVVQGFRAAGSDREDPDGKDEGESEGKGEGEDGEDKDGEDGTEDKDGSGEEGSGEGSEGGTEGSDGSGATETEPETGIEGEGSGSESDRHAGDAANTSFPNASQASPFRTPTFSESVMIRLTHDRPQARMPPVSVIARRHETLTARHRPGAVDERQPEDSKERR
ncbi:AAA family ATPase [Bifidobacterium sp. 82T10]|uniref:AAA family ATPase n=1 Tax=Bifidobacterium miconis TaxID=2834435 RepID=A0ABS6WEE9_9BIFI|nr:Ig-like domain-containing protein [Bifidobacterium miconis]MBW3091611.1 AAA family ATPase [Bifidobacterium miconis]